ncbi:MAG: cold shock domain-containing protein [Planctomycetales bacterium]|nr:cold shock domain-containing protein [Planctomycetales bacterium]
MAEGTIQTLNLQKGFGFLRTDGAGPDVFFHQSACPELFTRLQDGQRVGFELDEAADRPRVKKLWLGAGGQAFAGNSDRRPRTAGNRRPDGRGGGRPTNRAGHLGGSDRSRATGGAPRRGRPGDSSSRPPRRDDRPARAPRRESTRPAPIERPAECEQGFITKLVTISPTLPAHGFISSDKGGREIRFEPAVVQGDTRFMMLKVGDSVEFAVYEASREYTGPENHPTAFYVRVVERSSSLPRTQLPRHPRSRRRKPSWR